MQKRIAVVRKEKCNPHGCGGYLCMKVNPDNRAGVESIYKDEDGKVAINENLCGPGISIAVNKCPFQALSVVNLPEALNKDPIFRYGKNGFALYNLPIPIFGKVVGIIGRNGIGKSTAIKILAGLMKPNMGKEEEASERDVIEYFKGTEAHAFFEKVHQNKITISYKPQQVDLIPKQFKGTVKDLLEKVDEKNEFEKISETLELKNILDRKLEHISGGELQRVAIAATVLKKANVYFFDEPTSYLDIKQRLKIAKFLRTLADEQTAVLVIEHDLIILDYLTDMIHLMYGTEGVYGIVSGVKTTKAGINTYLSGYLREENVRFRDKAISFEQSNVAKTGQSEILTKWNPFEETLGDFHLKASEGEITKNTIIGILGENGIGKTSFVRALSGEGQTKQDLKIKVAYKPQYLEPSDELVMGYLYEAIAKFENQLINPLNIKPLFEKQLNQLSGGELQRVSIAKCLSQDADLFLMDEPSAYLDVEQRLSMSKVINDILFATGKSALIVDHDLLFLDYLSDKLIVFDGVPAVNGIVTGPFIMETGMNTFLKDLELSFRRDEETKRPRTNKVGSQKDVEQKKSGKLYYT